MTFAREKRLLLGVAALLVAWPLPLNQVLEWPVLAVFVAGVLYFLRRAWRGSERWLSNRALNALGLVYLPILVIDVATTGRVQLVRPVLHLTLFGILAKLGSLGRERDKWQAWVGIFFVFLAAMATSVHPAVVVYLAAFLAWTVAVLARFVHLHILSSFGHAEGEAPALPLGRFVAAAAGATLLVAGPLFALLPRVRSPYILAGAPGGGRGGEATAGFADEMSLDLVGRIRGNPRVALRVELAGRVPPPAILRLKAATFDVWEGRSWRRSRGAGMVRRDRQAGIFRLAPVPTVGTARIFLEPLRITSVPVPVETVAVDSDVPVLDLDQGGALFLKGMPSEVLVYTAHLAADPLSRGRPPQGDEDATLDPGGLTDRMRALAREWAGEGSAGLRATRIERHLLEDFGYTLEFIGRGGVSPLENFLFVARRGHCEYFASAMVLLLRAEGIPSRLVSGFLGAEYSWWDEAWLVRQSNAHVWVEGWIGGAWRTFDPTPPIGRPLAQSPSFLLYARQAYESLVFRWDRYVLSYDFDDQVSFASELRSLWDRLVEVVTRRDAARPEAAAPGDPAGAAEEAGEAAEGLSRWLVPGVSLFAALAAAAGIALWRRRPRWSPTLAYERLRATLGGAGLVAVTPAIAPLAFAEAARRRLPAAATELTRLVDVYLGESFAARPASAESLARALADLAAVEGAVRDLRRRRRGRRSAGSGAGGAGGGKPTA
jgi:transglutaminase-like putative cysteine protease